jgi:hypothetical protein
MAKKISEFFQYEGVFSHTRLISIVGSFISFGVFVCNPENVGVQNVVIAIIAFSLTNTTASKFVENFKVKGNE